MIRARARATGKGCLGLDGIGDGERYSEFKIAKVSVKG
jgi:hypothetical protein